MEGFYGGKAGYSFVLVTSFESVEAMKQEFRRGPAYTDVHFNEYVIVNTVDKMNLENGQIYRRGMDYNNEDAGAVYVGTIVGPAGLSPNLELKTIQEVRELSEQAGYNYRRGEGQYEPTVNLVPGKEEGAGGSVTYHDVVEWAYCSVRDVNSSDTTAYIGFKFPYMVLDTEVETKNPYTDADVTRLDDGTHPFYQKLKFGIPRGKNGNIPDNFRVIQATDAVEGYGAGQQDDILNGRQIIVYDYYDYADSADPQPTTIYLGDYNQINDILISDNGTFRVSYTHNDEYVREQLFQWITAVDVDTETGHLVVTYNTTYVDPVTSEVKNRFYEADLIWLSDIVIGEDGKITFKYTNGAEKIIDAKMKVVDEVSLAADGTLTITYNTGDQDVMDEKIRWIASVELSDRGVLTVNYNDGSPAYTTTLKWVADFSIKNDGTVTISYSDGTVKNYAGYLKMISNVTVNTGAVEGMGSQKVSVKYNNATDPEEIGNPLNYIMAVKTTEDHHLIVLYSDPVKRNGIPNELRRSAEYNGVSYDDWLDLDSIRAESGILVGLNVTEDELTAASKNPLLIGDVVDYLNDRFPNGLTGIDLEGKVVSVGTSDGKKNFYGFDYATAARTWYYLGGIDASNIGNATMTGAVDDPATADKKNSLAIGGVWFITED